MPGAWTRPALCDSICIEQQPASLRSGRFFCIEGGPDKSVFIKRYLFKLFQRRRHTYVNRERKPSASGFYGQEFSGSLYPGDGGRVARIGSGTQQRGSTGRKYRGDPDRYPGYAGKGRKTASFYPGKNGKRSENGNFHPFPSRSPGRRRRFSGKRSGDYCLRAENTGPGGLGIAAADSEQTGKQAVRLYPYGRRKYFPGNRPARGSRIWGAPRLYRAVNGLSGGQREP